MRNIIKTSIMGVFLTLFVGCSSDDAATINTAQVIKQIEDDVTSGTWRITSYIDSGENETNDYTGYSFTFANNGSLVARKGATTIGGTWSITEDDNSDDDDGNDDNDIDFNISFASPADFEELSDDWDIVSSSSTKISLLDISGGNGDTDTLVFERN